MITWDVIQNELISVIILREMTEIGNNPGGLSRSGLQKEFGRVMELSLSHKKDKMRIKDYHVLCGHNCPVETGHIGEVHFQFNNGTWRKFDFDITG